MAKWMPVQFAAWSDPRATNSGTLTSDSSGANQTLGLLGTGVSGSFLCNVGFIIVGLFVLTWAAATGYWRLANVEDRWTPAPTAEPKSS